MDSSLLHEYWNNVWLKVKEYDQVDASQVDAFFARLHPQVISDIWATLARRCRISSKFPSTWFWPSIPRLLPR